MEVWLADVAGEELVVAAVGFPGNVEDVAEDGDGADEDADADVDGHPDDGDVGDAADPGGEGDDEGEDAGEDISEAGDEADDAVDAEADAGAGDAEGFVEKDFELLEGAVAEEPGAAVPAVVGEDLAGGAEGGVGGRDGRWGELVRVGHAGWLLDIGRGFGPGLRAELSILVRCYNLKGRWRL